jgi:CIC family chloride channel protein
LEIWLPQVAQAELILVLALSYLVLGVLIGVCGAGFNAVLLACLRISDRLGRRKMLIVAASFGAVAGALMIIAPGFVGGGDSMVEGAFSSSPQLGFLVALLVVRTVMTFLSYSAGVPGGIFAPMLALGTLIGLGFGYSVQEVFPNADLPAGAFAVAAMGGLFAATVRAPLTGIVLVAELTSSFELLPAMVITCVTASITAQSLGSTPVYELLLARTLRRAENRASEHRRQSP